MTVAAWSAACGLNADYFSRLFKTHTGLAPKAWLLETRLQQASRLLDFGDKSVAEVAADCGFNCPFHFSRTFKRRFGIPPAGYRQLRHIRGFQSPETGGGLKGKIRWLAPWICFALKARTHTPPE